MLCQAQQSIQCSCPADSCMTIADSKQRCQCCVFVFLGKRSGPEMSVKYNENPKKKIFYLPVKRSGVTYNDNDKAVPKRIVTLEYLSRILPQQQSIAHTNSMSNEIPSSFDAQNVYNNVKETKEGSDWPYY